MSENKLKLVLCWHMHQPWYRESQDGIYRLPWVYLHAIKDYVDMVAHLEANPRVRVVVNFTPVLLEQLDDYARQLNDWLAHGDRFAEPLLNLLAGIDPVPHGIDERAELVRACMRAHAPNMIDIYPAYRKLLRHVKVDDKPVRRSLLAYLNDQYFLDLLTWYHLAWLGHSLRQRADVQQLMQKGHCFDAADRRILFEIMREAFNDLIPRYRRLAERGQIELSMTPYGHPIVPLLLDFDAMECAQPEAPRPEYAQYPGGLERARWHMQHGIDVFESHFGMRPQGVWLSEGAVSDAAVALLDEFGIAWTASGEGVWAKSCYLSEQETHTPSGRRSLFRCHALPATDARIFFRDDGLSDLIGFEYQQWNATDAARNFVNHINNIAFYLAETPGEHVVSVILDGENAWEYYQDNAFHFLSALYAELADCDAIELQTFAEAAHQCPPHPLKKLCAGSWVYGSFSTWIGEPDKNRAWDRLVEAKQTFDEVMHGGHLDPARTHEAERQLAICEGSDWFWWFGGYNPADSVRDFDELYRMQLCNLYRMLDRKAPANLAEPLSVGGAAAENAGTMRRGHEH